MTNKKMTTKKKKNTSLRFIVFIFLKKITEHFINTSLRWFILYPENDIVPNKTRVVSF